MQTIAISALDHFVLTVRDVAETVDFYVNVLGMRHEQFSAAGETRHALMFGAQKINLHQQGNEFKPGADRPLPGTADFCMITSTPIGEVAEILAGHGIDIIEGPVTRTGASGPLYSVYCRDPDRNLVEVANCLRPEVNR